MQAQAGNPFTPHGPSVLYELQLYVEAGLTPSQALAAATSGNAAILGLPDVGVLRAGAVADVLLVRGDPGANIADIWNVVEVLKGGVRVDRAAHAATQAKRRSAPLTLTVGRDLPPRLLGTQAADAAPRAWSGAWEGYSDSVAPGGKSTCALSWVEDGEGTRLRIEGTLTEGFAWGAFAGAAVLWDPERKLLADASQLTGLRLRIRGTPRDGNLTVQCAAVKDWNLFVAPLKPTAEWAVVDVPFASLRQIGFGRPVTWTGTDITGLNLEARNSPMGAPVLGPFHIEVDWIEFY